MSRVTIPTDVEWKEKALLSCYIKNKCKNIKNNINNKNKNVNENKKITSSWKIWMLPKKILS